MSMGANIDVGDGFALDALSNGFHYALCPVDGNGVITPYEGRPFPSKTFSDLKGAGVEIHQGMKHLKPGETVEIELAGHKAKVTANAEVGITLNGEPATPYTREIEKLRYGIE